jgi:formate hydrogenlyase subunit 6/NADH:ubiquinone oxidoreductase subunit I
MNNTEKANAKILRQKGFQIIYTETQHKLTYWAIHTKLICQYCIATCGADAIHDLEIHELTMSKHYPQQKLL